MREIPWRALAAIVTIPAVTSWLIERARRTPYTDIMSRDNTSLYMERLWLFNPYPPMDGPDHRPAWKKLLPSARIHHIVRADTDAHLHDHPWNARTIVLGPWYAEEREPAPGGTFRRTYWRKSGYTGRLLFGEYHRISEVPIDGVWTLFITWKKQGTWGFNVDGVKVPWRKYLGLAE